MIFDSKIRGMFIFFVALTLSLCVPALSSADADRIFKENSKSVVVVVAYDKGVTHNTHTIHTQYTHNG